MVASRVASLAVPAPVSVTGCAVTKPDILAEVERGDEAGAAVGHRGEHRSPQLHTAPAGPSQGEQDPGAAGAGRDRGGSVPRGPGGAAPQRAAVPAGHCLGKQVKSEEGVSPPPGSPPSRHTGTGNFPVPLQGERSCSCCGLPEPEPRPGAGNGGFIPPPPAFGSRRCRPGEPPPECGECGRAFGQRPDLVRHRPACGGECAHACGCCGRGCAAPAGLGGGAGPCRPIPGTGCSPGPAAPRKERKELSLTEKVRVLGMLEGPKVSQSELAKRFGVSQPQICRIIKNKERILSEWHRSGDPERKRRREGKDAALEAALLRWVEGARADDLPAGGPLLQLEARHLAQAPGRPDAEPSTARPARLGTRHDLTFEKPPVDKGDVEPHLAGAALPRLLRSYAPAEIYACGETGVLLPASSHGDGTGERLAVLLCTNADGSEKVPLRVVGESPQPRCLRGVNLPQMPWSYRAGSPASVTTPLFAEWLRELNEGMRRQGKSVLLLLAQHQARPCLQLSHVRMVVVPPDAAPDRGIADDLKGHYQCRLLRWLPAERGTGQPTLLDALHVLAQAWGDVCPGLITRCFRAAGCSPNTGAESPVLGQEHRALMDRELERDGDPASAQAAGDEGTAEGEDAGEAAAARPCPSEREVWRSLATLRRYLECRATAPELFRAFYQLEDAVHAVSAATREALLGDTPPMQSAE
ncbi:LOW QUALITY PROTEIN: tigger transposable element-derived protein 3-like [Pterocles gutturalis]